MKNEENSQRSFIALAIHKLKTPISSMKLSLEMLLEGDFGDLQDEQKKIIERIYQRNESLIDLVNDLFNLAKVNKKSSRKLSLINIVKLIQSVIDYEKDEVHKKSINIDFAEKEKDCPKFKADKEGMFLIVQNIVDNAIKYSNVGGDVLISVKNDDKNVKIIVKDYGIGIKEADKEKIFTEFFRGENAKEMHSMGSGLGLYITKAIVQEHGGKISFESKEHKGTTFFIEIPTK